MPTLEKSDRCKKSCCWTPYTCGRNRTCACHRPDDVLALDEMFAAKATPTEAPANVVPLFREPQP
ncbi:hypothetical protein [Arthrobacter sp. USHLN218]|uniref:hypothetical protein n=1 Tax=Arthrobacter sp. USHLN218 TaxID=3081232 RepID=UPI003015D27B